MLGLLTCFTCSNVFAVIMGEAADYVLLDIDNASSGNDGTFKSSATGLGGWADTSKEFKNDGGTWTGDFDLTNTSKYTGNNPSGSKNTKDFTQVKADVLTAETYIQGLPVSGSSYSYDFLTNRITEPVNPLTEPFRTAEYALGAILWYTTFVDFGDSGNVLDASRSNSPLLDDPNITSNIVWDFDKIDINGGNFMIEGNADDFVYIRVSDSDDFKLKDVNFTFSGGITSDRVFYYYEGEKVVWEGVSIAGTLIAPNAFVEIKDSDIDGVVISGDGFNIDGSTDLSYQVPVPEPSAYASILGISVLGLVALRRRGKA